MSAERVTKLLKNYRAYRYAVTQYERHHPTPSAGIANYSAMPGGSGAPEFFFDRVGKAADMGRTSLLDRMDYDEYKSAVDLVNGALETLTDEQQSVIRLKWMDDVNLIDIAQRKHISERTVKRIHKMALNSLEICLRFVPPPEVEKFGGQHMRFNEKERHFFGTSSLL